jgi:hypothetical protein
MKVVLIVLSVSISMVMLGVLFIWFLALASSHETELRVHLIFFGFLIVLGISQFLVIKYYKIYKSLK